MSQMAHQAGCYSMKQTRTTLYRVKRTNHGLPASTQLDWVAGVHYKVDSDLHQQFATFDNPE